MLACVYPSESFKTKAVAVKLKHGGGDGKSKKKLKLQSMKERPGTAKSNIAPLTNNELPVGGAGAVLVLSELESMATRQQREISQQRRLLEQREARLAVLRGTPEPAQQERLARLRHRLDQQQSKLNRLRLLRSQTDQSRANNATLTSDLDCIRALFNEKEKELSLAVAKVEELTRQLEDLRGRHNGNAGGQVSSAASAELEKLRRELMYRNKMNEQQNQVVSQQRMMLAQRQAEMASIDSRIAQLQARLQRKRALNQRLLSQQLNNNRNPATPGFEHFSKQKNHHHHHQQQQHHLHHHHQQQQQQQDFPNISKLRPAGNVAAIEPYSHIPNDNDFNLNKNDPKYQTLPYNTKFTVNLKSIDDDVNNKNNNKIQHSQSASQIGQRTIGSTGSATTTITTPPTTTTTTATTILQQLGHQIAHSQSQSHIQGQSQLLGNNQTTQQQQSNNFHTNNNNNNNNNNINNNINNSNNNSNNNNNNINNNNNNNNNTGTSLINQETRQSLTQAHNHRNLQIHQKPVSSVAPSFPVKSPIYQTSSTKIHPVMPQTLSMIGRNHAGLQNYNERTNQQQLPSSTSVTSTGTTTTATLSTTTTTATTTTTTTTTNDGTRHNQQGQFNQGYKNNFSSCGNTNYQLYQSQNYNQNQDNQIERLKYNNDGKCHDRYDVNKQQLNEQQLNRYDNKHEQQMNNTVLQRYEQSIKLDVNNKYDNNSQLPITHQYGKHEHDLRNGGNSLQYKHDGNNYQQQFKQIQEQQIKLDKHDHGIKLEPPSKQLFDNNERKGGNFIDNCKIDDKIKPALPPKPVKPNPPPRLNNNNQDKSDSTSDTTNEGKSTVNRNEKEEEVPPIPTSEPPESPNETSVNHQIIKARPLNLKKSLLSDPPRLRYAKSNVHVSINRRIEMPPAFLFPETEIPADLMQTDQQQQQQQSSQQIQQQQQNNPDVTDHISMKQTSHLKSDELTSNDKLEDSDIVDALNVINIEDKLNKNDTRNNNDNNDGNKTTDVIRRKKGNLKSTTGKVNLSRRVSFDPLALLLDASLEGELELVKKTAKEVANPSSANDEGITALHNSICAGHFDIVKYLVEFGCDVNAQDSDGWTPLHCAASCNNLAMVKFLVEHGACIFATTLSDHETAAEKCEEDEEGFDGCSEYLYSVQEKLGIMNNGQVFAVFDYDAQHNDELTLKNGDQLIILRKGDDNEREWWWSKLGHREGYVPRNLLGLYPRVQPE